MAGRVPLDTAALDGKYTKMPDEPMSFESVTKKATAAIKNICEFYRQEIFGINCRTAEAKFKKLDAVVAEERLYIDQTKQERMQARVTGLQDGEGIPFSVAFSGGGIRAAAFQAGVLWQLAEQNKLKDVEYLSAVSGGSYIQTAFATHCMDRDNQPEPGQNINEWYKKVVGETIVKMQDNCGNFIRDCNATPGYDKSTASCPRWADSFVLIGMIFYTIMVNPVVITLCLGVPVVDITAVFYGSGLRAAFCADIEDWQSVFQQAVGINSLAQLAVVLLCITFFAMVMNLFIRKPDPWTDRQKPKPEISKPVQLQRSIFFLGTRGLCIVLAFMVWLYAIPWYERALYEGGKEVSIDGTKITLYRKNICCEYMSAEHFRADCDGFDNCVTFVDSCKDSFVNGDNSWEALGVKTPKECTTIPPQRHIDENNLGVFDKATHFLRKTFSTYYWAPIAGGILGLFFFGVILIPFFGAGIAMNVLFVAGPLFAFAASVSAATIPIFGPMTKGLGNATVDFATFHKVSQFSLGLAILAAPLYESFRNLFHVFYARVLQSNYFKDGMNHRLHSLTKYKFAPFIIFTGTCSDYQAAGDNDSIAEVSFSPLHIGSEETDFVPTQHWFRMATGTALSGAGCVDGIGLAMSDLISLRFWLELLNLSWGDFIVFDAHTHAQTCSEWVGPKHQDGLIRMLFRAPSMIALFFVYLMFFIAYSDTSDCQGTKSSYYWGLWTFLVIVVASLFDFEPLTPISRFMTMSPFIRQLHQLLKFTFSGRHPPPMLYVTDGGVQDCTTVGLLMKRRVKRILLVSCGQDPQCKMGNFKDAMKKAQEHNLGGFYVPEDPRKEVWVRLDEFKADLGETHIQVGIRYPEVRDDKTGNIIHHASYGHLIIVKNKLPSQLVFVEDKKTQVPIGDWPVLPRITEKEVETGERFPPNQEFRDFWKGMKQNELGSVGCCDCCHVNPKLNLCNKWPQGFFGNYLFLSPMFGSSLMRLGHQLSRDPIRMISTKKDLREPWERQFPQDRAI